MGAGGGGLERWGKEKVLCLVSGLMFGVASTLRQRRPQELLIKRWVFLFCFPSSTLCCVELDTGPGG